MKHKVVTNGRQQLDLIKQVTVIGEARQPAAQRVG
jgi:hypothetical protein